MARVNDKPISKAEVDRMMAKLVGAQRVDPANLPQFQAATLQQLVRQRLLFEMIEREGLTATADEINRQIENLRAQLKQQRKATLEEAVRQQGMTIAALRSQIASDVSLHKLFQRHETEEALQDHFQRHARQFDGTQLRVSHILLRPRAHGDEAETEVLRARAEQIKRDIESGKLTFADAARKHSHGPSRQDGGDLGFIGRKGPMLEQFNRAAFELEEGKVSEPVVTTFGVHLITVTEVKPGDKTLHDARKEVTDAFRAWLIEDLVERELPDAKVEFHPGFPHFKPGTRELASAGK